jgi:hypothetical protein
MDIEYIIIGWYRLHTAIIGYKNKWGKNAVSASHSYRSNGKPNISTS